MFKNILLAFVSLVLLSACGLSEVEDSPSEDGALIENENKQNNLPVEENETICHAEELSETEKNVVVDGWKRYRNTEYCFEIEYLAEWTAYDEGGRFIRFANYDSADAFREEVRQNPDAEPYKATFIWIFLKDEQTFYDVKAQYMRRSEYTLDFETSKGAITLYVDSVRSKEQDESWDTIIPDFQSFLESDDYNFMIYTSTPSLNNQEQEEKLELLKRALKTFKFLN